MLNLIIGKRELGKTTLAVNLARYHSTRVIFDPRHMINTSRCILTDSQIKDGLYNALDTEPEIIIRPHFDKEAAFEATCEEIYQWLQDSPGEPLCFLVDESRFVSEPEKNQHFDYIVRCLPSSQVTVILTCHGIVDVSTDLRRIADYWILFRLTMESDLDRVRERCGDTVADEVQRLEPFQYIVWNDQKSVYTKKTEPRKWYVKLESPGVLTV
jgi:hypothetical protein